jgi:signal transduction histidine kinase
MPQRQEKTLKRFREFDALASMSAFGVLLLDREAGLQFASSIACLLLGEKSQGSLQRVWPDVQSKLNFSRLPELKEGGDPLRYRVDYSTPAGPRLLRLEAYSLEHKSCDSYLVLLKNRQTLDDAESQFLLASQLRAQTYFTAALVHDLNAPINNILLTLELLDAGFRQVAGNSLPADLVQRLHRYQTVLREEMTRLNALVKSLPERLGAAKSPQEEFDLRAVVEEVNRRLKHDAAAKQMRRNLELGSSPLPVYGSQERIRLALFNVAMLLLESARSAGNLRIAATQHEHQAQVAVYCDTARMDARSMAVLHRLSLPSDPPGIGLFAARLIVEYYDGELAAETDADIGAGFRISLPLRPMH